MKITLTLQFWRGKFSTQCQYFDFNFRRIIKKISYERRDYESVNEKIDLSLCPEKLQKKRIQAVKG